MNALMTNAEGLGTTAALKGRNFFAELGFVDLYG